MTLAMNGIFPVLAAIMLLGGMFSFGFEAERKSVGAPAGTFSRSIVRGWLFTCGSCSIVISAIRPVEAVTRSVASLLVTQSDFSPEPSQ